MILDERTQKGIKELAGTGHANHLRAFIAIAKADIVDVTKTESWEEALGKKYAVKVLDDLFGFLREDPLPKGKNNYQ